MAIESSANYPAHLEPNQNKVEIQRKEWTEEYGLSDAQIDEAISHLREARLEEMAGLCEDLKQKKHRLVEIIEKVNVKAA